MPQDFRETVTPELTESGLASKYTNLEKAMGAGFSASFSSATSGESGSNLVKGQMVEYLKWKRIDAGIDFVKSLVDKLEGSEVRTFVWNNEGKRKPVSAIVHRLPNDKGGFSDLEVIEVIDLEGCHLEDGSCEVVEILFKNCDGEFKKMTDYLPPGVKLRSWPNLKENGKYLNRTGFYPVLSQFRQVFLALHEFTHAWQEAERGKFSDEEAWSRLRLESKTRGKDIELSPEDYKALKDMATEEREAWAGAIRTVRQWKKEGFDLYPGIVDRQSVGLADTNMMKASKA